MTLNESEIYKLLHFIKKNILFIFNKKVFTLKEILKIEKISKTSKKYNLKEDKIVLLKKVFLSTKKPFDKDTPKFILSDDDCIKHAVTLDITNSDYIYSCNDDVKDFIIKEALKHNYILNAGTNEILNSNYEVAYNSIKKCVNSANFINWEKLTKEQQDKLIEELINRNYRLSVSSPSFLQKHNKIVLSSIKQDIKTIEYANENMINDKDIFEYLINIDFEFEQSLLDNLKLSNLTNLDTMKKVFELYGMFSKTDDNEYKFFNDIINSKPKISDLKKILIYYIEKEWKTHKRLNRDTYENIFGKTCAILQNAISFDRAKAYMQYLENIEITLGDKYKIFYKAMKDYYNLYHSNKKDSINQLQKPKDIIAALSSLYIAKSKENFKKENLNELSQNLLGFYILKKDNKTVNKLITEKKQLEELEKLYINNDSDIINFCESLKNKYEKLLDKEKINTIIDSYITKKNIVLLSKPKRYDEYITYNKVQKLIKRLNKKYINLDGPEVKNYKNHIKLEQDKYICTITPFTKEELHNIKNYIQQEEVSNNIKYDIMTKAKTIKVSKINRDDLETLNNDFPINDEFYKFDQEKVLNEIDLNTFEEIYFNSLRDLPSDKTENILKLDNYKLIKEIFIDSGALWLLYLMGYFYFDDRKLLESNGFFDTYIMSILENTLEVKNIAKSLNIDIKTYKDFVELLSISKCATENQLHILGENIIKELYNDQTYTNEEPDQIIDMATELISEMVPRTKSTVPFIEGKTQNYQYSLYDFQENDILLSGIKTDACFRIDGTDNDFFHYCALDKNGFVIKITNSYGEFVGRASGFRNGNVVYINQLRTIYDNGGVGYSGDYIEEQKEIIEVFKKACKDIVSTSQNNKEEKEKIDFVLVNQSYSLKIIESNVSNEVVKFIGDEPMDNQSEDWNNFIYNTKNLEEADKTGKFETDFGDYPLICVASTKGSKRIKSIDLNHKDVEAVYERKRNPIIIRIRDKEIQRKINKIKAIYCYQNLLPFEKANAKPDSTVFLGDNWFIIVDNWTILDSCVIERDTESKKEYEVTYNLIKAINNMPNPEKGKIKNQINIKTLKLK